jgi:hypothetical protein
MNDIKNRLEFIINESDKILKHFDSSKGDDTHFFCLYMMERLNFSSRGLSTLLKDIISQSQLEYCCGIIMRTVLLDYMIVLNAHVIISENINNINSLKEKLNEFSSIMLSDCINHTIEDAAKLKIPQDDLKKIYRGIAKMYSDWIEPYKDDGTKPVPLIKKKYSNRNLFEKLFNSTELRKYANIYQAYLFYSKYDHFGRMYYDLVSDSFDKRMQRVNESIKAFPRMLMFTFSILVILNPKDKFLLEELNLVINFNDSY